MGAKAKRGQNEPVITSTEAQLCVADVKVSCEFYTGKLGFTIAFVFGEPPHYAQLVRDQARLNVRAVTEPVFVADIREREQLLSASLTLKSADALERLFRTFAAANVRFAQTLRAQPWGASTFIVSDPDGNLILFAGPSDA